MFQGACIFHVASMMRFQKLGGKISFQRGRGGGKMKIFVICLKDLKELFNYLMLIVFTETINFFDCTAHCIDQYLENKKTQNAKILDIAKCRIINQNGSIFHLMSFILYEKGRRVSSLKHREEK